MNRALFMFFLLFACVTSSVAQHQRNYIYLFDCTKSMKNNGIWEPSKDFLHKEIDKLDDNSIVTIVLFHQDLAIPVAKFIPTECKWKEIEKKCDEMIEKSTNTGICNAWDKGIQFIDPHKNNYLYLFTDGLENVNPGKTAAVCARIRQWCQLEHNNYAFFVALPSKELLNSPEVKKLKEATEDCDRTFYITSSFGPFGAFDRTSFNLNSHSIKNIKTGFSDYGTFKARVVCNDPYYEVKLKDNIIKDGKAEFVVKEKKAPSANHQIHIKVKANPKELHISKPDIFINIDTRNLANLDMAQLSGLDNGQYDAGMAKTYNSFLFWGSKDNDTVSVDLGAVFNDEAKRNHCSLMMNISSPSTECKYIYNGISIIKDQFIIDSKDAKSLLQIIVPHSTPTGDFIIGLKGNSSDLETINAEESKSYVSSIRVEHEICWNPLKTILFWTIIILVIFLVLWFTSLRSIFYPRIRLSRIQMINDEVGYYVSKKINSAKKVIVGPVKGHQGFLNRIFTRRIVYISSPIWTATWEMTPNGHKKAVRINLHGGYMIEPITSELVDLGTYKLIDRKNNKVITIKIL